MAETAKDDVIDFAAPERLLLAASEEEKRLWGSELGGETVDLGAATFNPPSVATAGAQIALEDYFRAKIEAIVARWPNRPYLRLHPRRYLGHCADCAEKRDDITLDTCLAVAREFCGIGFAERIHGQRNIHEIWRLSKEGARLAMQISAP